MAVQSPLRFVTAFAEYTAAPSDIIGQGGSGTVYRALDSDGNNVAIKVLDPKKATKEKKRRFKNEILFGSGTKHPNIVEILDSGSVATKSGESSFYVMRLYSRTLRDLMRAGIPMSDVLRLFGSLMNGVEAAHLKGVFHRDLKPENVLFDEQGQMLVVTDFGVAHFSDEERFTVVETAPGTRLANFQYAAPEQRDRLAAVDQRADIYALGLILNEMFTGVVPHGTDYETVSRVSPDFAFVDQIIAEMIRQKPAQRPSTIDSIKQQLQARQQEFITRQKLNELQGTVVPIHEVVDPLIDDPIRIVSFDVDGPHSVTLRLNRAPSEKWLQVARNTHGYSYPMGYDPKPLLGRNPTVQVEGYSDSLIQQIVNSLKELISYTNRDYPEALRQEAERRRLAEQRQLQESIESERKRLELSSRLTI